MLEAHSKYISLLNVLEAQPKHILRHTQKLLTYYTEIAKTIGTLFILKSVTKTLNYDNDVRNEENKGNL